MHYEELVELLFVVLIQGLHQYFNLALLPTLLLNLLLSPPVAAREALRHTAGAAGAPALVVVVGVIVLVALWS